MAVAIVDLKTMKEWGPVKLEQTVDDRTLKRAIDAASDWIEFRTDRTWKAPAEDQTDLYDGSGPEVRGKYRELLRLRSPLSAIPTSVTEDGVALTIATGYTTTADVVADLARGVLFRRTLSTTVAPTSADWTGWRPGFQNIAVVAKPGVATVPNDVVQVCIEAAWLIYKESRRTGKMSMSRGGASTTFEKALSDFALEVLNARSRWGP